MKKFNYTFLIFAIVTAILFVLTGAFALGEVSSPSSYWLTTVKSDGNDVEDAAATITLDRKFTSLNEEGNETSVTENVAGAYVYIGKVYQADDNGDIVIHFDFKAENSADTYYSVRKTAVLSADGANRYNWVRVFDDDISECSAVKIHTEQTFEFCEVVFVTADGRRIKPKTVKSETAFGDSSYRFASALIDEQKEYDYSADGVFELSAAEVKEIDAANALLYGGSAVGGGVLSVSLNALSLLLFGRNAFAVRFFSLIAGYAATLLTYYLGKKIFGSDKKALVGGIVALCACSLFGASVTASAAIGVPLMLAAYSQAIVFYTRLYKAGERGAAGNLLLTGLFIALAATASGAYLIASAGIIALWILSAIKLRKEFKTEYEQAKGLGKEEVYLAYTGKGLQFGSLAAVALIVLPAIFLTAGYALVKNPVYENYGGSFIEGSWKHFISSFGFSYSAFPLSYLIGIGTDGNLFLNFLPCLLAAAGAAITTVAVFFGKKGKLSEMRAKIKNKYIVTGILCLSAFLPLSAGFNQSVAGFSLCSCVYALFVPLGLTAIKKAMKRKTYKILQTALLAACVVTFAAAYAGIVGAVLPQVAANILYGWQRV